MGAGENKFQISPELKKTQVKSSCVRIHFVKFEAFGVILYNLLNS